MDKLITITITDGENEYSLDFIMENVKDFSEVIKRIEQNLDI